MGATVVNQSFMEGRGEIQDNDAVWTLRDALQGVMRTYGTDTRATTPEGETTTLHDFVAENHGLWSTPVVLVEGHTTKTLIEVMPDGHIDLQDTLLTIHQADDFDPYAY
jgi:hypothetical protein